MRPTTQALTTAAVALAFASGAQAAKPEDTPGNGTKDVPVVVPPAQGQPADPGPQAPPAPPENGNGKDKDTAPGQGKQDEPKPVPPGQAKKDDPNAVPPGQAKKDNPAALPPGKAKQLADDLLSAPLDAAEIGAPLFADPAHTSLGETLGLAPTGGVVRVKAPDGQWQTLAAGQPVPVGTVVDATDGNLEIAAEAVGGVEQHAIVGGGMFVLGQDPALKGPADLSLRGGDFRDCSRKAAPTARAAARDKKGDVVRGLWASGKGRFRTHGRNATATVRGTHWITVDRCHSTTVRVEEGVVDVADKATGKRYTVRAGERRVVRAPR